MTDTNERNRSGGAILRAGDEDLDTTCADDFTERQVVIAADYADGSWDGVAVIDGEDYFFEDYASLQAVVTAVSDRLEALGRDS